MRMGSLNVGSMAGKGREAEDLVMRRKIEVLRVQETRCRERQQGKSWEKAVRLSTVEQMAKKERM